MLKIPADLMIAGDNTIKLTIHGRGVAVQDSTKSFNVIPALTPSMVSIHIIILYDFFIKHVIVNTLCKIHF